MSAQSLWHSIRDFLGFGSSVGLPPNTPAAPAPPVAAFNFDDDRIPDTSRTRIKLIRALLTDLEERAGKRGLVMELSELKRLRTKHLPKLLQSYIEIPPEHRAEVFRETGRSASYRLNERLDKMTQRLLEISMMLARGHLDPFAENMRFIDLRYGSPDSPFD